MQQFKAVRKIQEVFNTLKDYTPPDVYDVDNPPPKNSIPKGFYLHGGVGTGKTLLLDLFYDCMPAEGKKRVHFHSFMLYLYSEMNRWNLCLDEDADDFISPTEHIANKIMEDTWLVCFDEIQLADYASCTLLYGVLTHMLSKGAVIAGTSNRAPLQLGDINITDQYDGDLENVTDTVGSFAAIFEQNCLVHEVSNERDHRNELKPGECRYFHPCSQENSDLFDNLFAKTLPLPPKISSSVLTLYGRKILVPLSSGNVARFTFNDLCCNLLGPADYIKICNSFKVVFVDNIPKLTMNQKNEARRFITFIDAAYESRVQVYCTAEASFDDLFLLLPRDDGNYEPEQMHVEMMGEIAYDLQIHGMDFKSLNILSGKDEIFSFRRAVSRLKEFQSAIYQSSSYRTQEFLPYLGSKDEVDQAQSKRGERDQRRRQKFKEMLEEEGLLDGDGEVDREKINNRSFSETDWGDEASYKSLSKEAEAVSRRNRKAPNFGDQHFWGMGWWEKVRGKWQKKKKKK